MDFLIVTGMSGAGKSRVAGFLEDLGYYCVDNMPVELIPKFAELCMASQGIYERVALVTDVRAGESFQTLFQSLDTLQEMGCEYRIVFVEAALQTIVHRYKETRRRHPLSGKGKSIEEAFKTERDLLEPVRTRADYIIDTTNYVSVNRLRERVVELFGGESPRRSLVVSVTSFGFKYGVPGDVDLVFDVRFLPNPFYIENLRPQTGLDTPVREFVFSFPETQEFLKHLYGMIDFLLPQYMEEGKASLVIGIGCTGGRHRSVAIAAALAEYIREKGYYSVLGHRDMTRN